jgi:hypothetical protein
MPDKYQRIREDWIFATPVTVTGVVASESASQQVQDGATPLFQGVLNNWVLVRTDATAGSLTYTLRFYYDQAGVILAHQATTNPLAAGEADSLTLTSALPFTHPAPNGQPGGLWLTVESDTGAAGQNVQVVTYVKAVG